VEEIVAARTDSGRPPAAVPLPEHVEEDGAPGPGAPTSSTPEAGTGLLGRSEPSTSTSARGLAMVGEDVAPTSPGAAEPGRGPRPDVRPGQPLSRYGDDDFDALVTWIAADGTPRTVTELREELRAELGIARRGTHVDAVLGAAARRSGLAVEPAEAASARPADEAGAA